MGAGHGGFVGTEVFRHLAGEAKHYKFLFTCQFTAGFWSREVPKLSYRSRATA